MRCIPRSRHAGARDPGQRSRCHFRHGRLITTANLAIHTAICQAHRRLAARLCAHASQGHPHHQPTENLQRCVRPIQTILARKTAQPNHFPQHRSAVAAQTHLAEMFAPMLWRHIGDSACQWRSVV